MWADEFQGDAVDRTKWDFDLGNGFYDYRNHAWVPGWGNEELQYYTHEPENVVVADSCLFIRAVKAPMHGCGYTSARLKTRKRDGSVRRATIRPPQPRCSSSCWRAICNPHNASTR